ncbi:MAG: CCA tRNA nucleotidyltransferase [Candidatus Omnitrophota bacterium]|nr:MAG: CCA tRNA nucleotidyltransferase [Candidatus Omnitrophota bacterium]
MMKNLQLKKRLPKDVFSVVRKIGTLAEESGFFAYIVGGFVRDLLLGVKNLDLDIVIERDALDVARLLRKKIDFQLKTHKRFGTATIILPSGFKMDIATSRREHYAYPAALPAVCPSSIRDDLFRRDFTINALAIKLNQGNFGQLLDLFDGCRDLKKGLVRVLHDKSFIDDPTRILRAVRFEQRYDFTIEEHTKKLIDGARRAGMLKQLSRFRIGDELILILKEEDPLRCLLRLNKLCGLDFIHPSIKLGRGISAGFKRAKKYISLSDEALDGWLVYFMLLTCPLDAKQIRGLCRDFSLTKSCQQRLEYFKKNASGALKELKGKAALSNHRIYEVLQPFSCEGVLGLTALTESRTTEKRIRLFLKKLTRIKTALQGKDLERIGLEPGPKYRQILKKVLYEKLDGKLKNKREELKYAKWLSAS